MASITGKALQGGGYVLRPPYFPIFFFLFDGKNVSFGASLVIYIYKQY
jgi:hypothetical protein